MERAALAAPEEGAIHAVRAELDQRRRERERSLMAKGIFGAAARESAERAAARLPASRATE